MLVSALPASAGLLNEQSYKLERQTIVRSSAGIGTQTVGSPDHTQDFAQFAPSQGFLKSVTVAFDGPQSSDFCGFRDSVTNLQPNVFRHSVSATLGAFNYAFTQDSSYTPVPGDSSNIVVRCPSATPYSASFEDAASLAPFRGTGTIQASYSQTLDISAYITTFQAGPISSLTVRYYGYSHTTAGLSAAGDKAIVLDFGTVYKGATATLPFSIYNNGDANAVPVDLTSVSAFSKSVKAFSHNLTPFTGGLEGGGSAGYLMTLNTARTGSFLQAYTLNLAETNVGPGALSLAPLRVVALGTVVNPPRPPRTPRNAASNAVPAPAPIGLLALGLLPILRRRFR